jgi:HSP20 family protein
MAMLMEPVAPWLRDMNRFLTSESAVQAFLPPADVLVTAEGVMVYMDVPGVQAQDLEVDLDNDVLTIRGERRFPYGEEGTERAWRRIERAFGRFERSLRVPRGMDPETIDAMLVDGVLSLKIPRPQTPEPRRVEIKQGAATPQAETITGQASEAGGGATSGGAAAPSGATAPGSTPGA